MTRTFSPEQCGWIRRKDVEKVLGTATEIWEKPDGSPHAHRDKVPLRIKRPALTVTEGEQMTPEEHNTVAQALWAAHEVWILPVSDRQNWDEMTPLEKERWFNSAEIVGPGLIRTLSRRAYEQAAKVAELERLSHVHPGTRDTCDYIAAAIRRLSEGE